MDPSMSAREALVGMAMELVGNHYTLGGYGNTPGEKDGSPFRRDAIYLHTPVLTTAGLRLFCAGSPFKAPENQPNVCGGGIRPSSMGTRPAFTSDWDLQEYLKQQRARTPKDAKRAPDPVTAHLPYEPFQSINGDGSSPWPTRYSPREAFEAGKSKGLYWGQDCRLKRHFDCIGFINFAMWRLTGVAYSLDIPGWINNTVAVAGSLQAGAARPDGKPDSVAAGGDTGRPWPGDILILYKGPGEHQHIAFATGKGFVVQASDTLSGVHADTACSYPKDPSFTWTHMRRIPGNMLAAGK